jgi:hypothetical protein
MNYGNSILCEGNQFMRRFSDFCLHLQILADILIEANVPWTIHRKHDFKDSNRYEAV